MHPRYQGQSQSASKDQNIKTDPEIFFDLIFPYLSDIAVGVECVFCWYWLSDLCAEHHIRFVLGHALYMKAIHGGKTKNDKIDSYKLASFLKGGNFHAIRHLSASILYQKGYSLSVIQAILRHKNPNTTARYLRTLGLEQTREALEKGLTGPAQVIQFEHIAQKQASGSN